MSIAMHFREYFYDNFGVGTNPHRNVRCLISCEHGKVVLSNLPAVAGYIEDEPMKNSWVIAPNAFIIDRENGGYILPLDERDAYPCVANRRNKGKRDECATAENVNKLSANAFSRAIANEEQRQRKSVQSRLILLAFVIVAVILALMCVVAFMPTIIDKF